MQRMLEFRLAPALVSDPNMIIVVILMYSEMAYGIRYVERNKRNVPESWSIRQTAIYHKFRSNKRSSTWIMISASERTERCLDRYVKSCRDVASLSPFEIHLIVLDTALANWRPYIVGLTEKVTEQVYQGCCSLTSFFHDIC